MQFEDLDWNHLWQEARQKKAWKKKSRTDWDRKAYGFARRHADSFFIERLLDLLQPQSEWSVLDVGSGPGTLALPLARQIRHLTALDFSKAMLQELQKAAARYEISNITTCPLSWTDDWLKAGIEQHDITISCRSLTVFDLKSALQKLNDWAKEKVFVVDRVGSGPFDPDLFKAVGRDFEAGPDYIFTCNLLYQMGINARVDFIELGRLKRFSNPWEAVVSCRWMLEPISKEEEKRLHDYVDARLSRGSDGSWLLHRSQPLKWAFLSWEKG